VFDLADFCFVENWKVNPDFGLWGLISEYLAFE
jgi:hypothetical protein